MAEFLLPIGLGKMLRGIAEGIGDAARIVPQHSRSEVGALAVHRASVEVNFELSAAARDDYGTIGIGARTFLFGPSIATGSNETTAVNTGRITLEIVAITEPDEDRGQRLPGKPPTGPAPAPDPDILPTAEAIRAEIGRMQSLLAQSPVSEEDRSKVAALLDRALEHLAAGDLGAARAIIFKLVPAFEALGDAIATTDAPARSGGDKKKKKKG